MRVREPKHNLERLERFFLEVNECHLCQKCSIVDPKLFQKPVVDIRNAQLSEVDVLFISEAASEEDLKYRVPFTGVTGLFFRHALYQAGVNDSSVVLTNAVVCRPTEESGINRIPTLTELENCSDRIKVFVETLKPKAVCLVGAVARDFYGKKLLEWKYMGQVWLIHHPAYILRLGGDTSQAYQDWVDSIRDVLSSTR